MTALNRDQRLVFLLAIFSIWSGCVWRVSEAQTFTAEDRNSIQKFMDSLINFLELEASNINTTLTTPLNGTSVGTTTLASVNSTELTTETPVTTADPTTNVLDGSTSTLDSTTVAFNPTTPEIIQTTRRQRICFKRFCYKFSNDKGYII
ncbi:uncharacterized protein LOC108091290 [Drosophila ficusphila]|uniref:uncharacterized protein LOC108091290 n=1 Tax=Drosophila ficusphila TaxID=30025 RepID=UPI0007E85240|nr:uncharacterized protein LOC108091290 [Drosophila ficusphila]